MLKSVCSVALLLFLVAPLSQAQTGDAVASNVAQKSAAALTGGNFAADATITGTVTRTVGPDTDTGTFTLKVKGYGKSRVELALGSGLLVEVVANNTTKDVQCFWSDKAGAFHAAAVHNCWTDAAWFFPALGSLVQNPNVQITYIGEENRSGHVVEHVRVQRQIADQKPASAALAAKLSTTDFYVDSRSYLPTVIASLIHPDDDLQVNIPVEIRLADYRSVQGIQVPFHVQKYVNGVLHTDLHIASAAVNSGLPDSDFIAK